MPDNYKKFNELLDIISRLRGPGGCPWDMQQTPQTLKKYLLEETHELMEALTKDEPDLVREELGDLLFIIILLNNIYSEKNLFSLTDVIEDISKKMKRRHPHVFGNEKVDSLREQSVRWQKIKGEENQKKNGIQGMLNAIPKTLPALRRAQRVLERAARNEFDLFSRDELINGLDERTSEFNKAVSSGVPENAAKQTGAFLFRIVDICRLSGINAEEALDGEISDFINRLTGLEESLGRNRNALREMDRGKRTPLTE